MLNLLLLGTSGCHLCEEAEAIIASCQLDKHKVSIEMLDIVEQDQYQAEFSLFIPVLYHPYSLKRLNWPFDAEQVHEFVGQYNTRTY